MSEMENTNTQVLTTVATETPPVPRKRKADCKSAHQGALADRPMTVYDSLFEYCLSIPISRISHLPAAKEQAILCPQHTETGKCNEGDECSAVHADIEGLEKMTIHINYAWRSPEHVTYARLPAGEFLTVLAPNNRPPTDTIESHFVLSTKGSLNRQQVIDGRPMSHCAHYYFNRVCNRGEHCSFIHAITIDPLAEDGQRAPAPQVVHRNSKATPTGAALPAASEPESVPPTVVVTQPLEAKLLAAQPLQGALSIENSGYHSDSSACSMSIKSSKSTTSARSDTRTDSVRVDSYVRFTDDAYDGSITQPTPCTYETVYGTRVLLLYNHEIIGYRHNPYFGLNQSLQCGL